MERRSLRTARWLLPLPALAVLAACADKPSPSEATAPGAAAAASAAPQVRRFSRGIEDEFLQMQSSEVPGFGGFYVDEAGDIVAYVTDSADEPRARGAIQRLLARDARRFAREDGSRPSVHVRRGEYGFSQLVQWSDALQRGARPAHGISLFDADEMKNRVRIGIADRSQVAGIQALAESLGVPRGALHFELRRGTNALVASLRDVIRPTGAGTQVNINVGTEAGACTMGFNVTDPNGQRYFLTAGHCTQNYAGPTGRVFYQPGNSFSDRVGVEALNPAWSTTGCGVGASYCRATDAALIQYDSNILSDKRVAQSSTVGSGNSAGNLTIGTWYGVATYGGASVGQEVHKTGRTTGSTRGPVTGTCVNAGVFAGANTEVPCAYEAQARANGGDSGSPVYRFPLFLQPSYRAAIGILWGTYIPAAGETYKIYYSGLDQIEADLGITLYPI
ncbi:MAG TPA: S1 family peptidase [Longimicrobiaceae bacterium]|jgi:hypothetical protein